jgi:hypothetical protein
VNLRFISCVTFSTIDGASPETINPENVSDNINFTYKMVEAYVVETRLHNLEALF